MAYVVSSTVFNPRFEGEQFLVVASAGSTSAGGCIAQKSTWARSLEEATLKCCELARLMCGTARAQGARVSRICCSHCPEPGERHCP